MAANSRLIGNTGERMSKVSMRLFGMPYQMPPTVDIRDASINPAIGRSYLEKFLMEAPILTIIPGDPVFLPEYHGNESKLGAAQALLSFADDSSKFAQFRKGFGKHDNDLRLYDFKKAYREYMKYVNILCRVGAGFLDLNSNFTINGSTVDFQSFDWKKYKWTNSGSNPQNFLNWLGGSFKSSKQVLTEDDMTDYDEGMSFAEVLNDYDFIQFYIDPESTSGDDMGNTSSESKLKGLFDQGSDMTKEFAWMMKNSEMTGDMAKWATENAQDLSSYLTEALSGGDGALSSISSALSRIINLSGNVVMGENIMIPNIYQNSQYNKSGFSATIHLKAPYGNVMSYYLDVFVPMMHLLALTIPRQSSPNTYSSPFLCKSFVEGSWTCNLGLVSGLTFTKNNEARSINGLPSEVDVTIQFEDLYSTLSMNPSSEPIKFAKNSSLIEYLATNCGMSLTKPNAEKKVDVMWNTLLRTFTDAPGNVTGTVLSAAYENTIGKLRSLFTV